MDINDAIIILRARMKSLIRKIDSPEREALQTAIKVMEGLSSNEESEFIYRIGYTKGKRDGECLRKLNER